MENFTQIIHWQGYEIELSYNARSYNLSHISGPNMVHIELRTVKPERAPLPVTESGYRSHFEHAQAVAEYENPVEYVMAWLDHAAKNSNWQQVENNARQFSLF
ncbi:hypothetical protein [Kordiimonas pumila]|uniref:Uncharacterized protein n=1 Tax=Kordiimonas pumila TaxID=2161677 RepID=A0ABV7D579_9PROT|nr:hypothetical protein [Kordiimonas pumila]